MALFSGSYTFTVNTTIPSCDIGDVITFEFISDYQFTTSNWTGSISDSLLGTDYLKIDLVDLGIAQYPFTTASFQSPGFITNITRPNGIQFSPQISQYYGNTFSQLPLFESSSTISSSLYPKYGDILYPFSASLGDKIILTAYDGHSEITTVKQIEYTSASGSQLTIYVFPDLDKYWTLNTDKISQFLLVKRLQDEQNVIMGFTKQPGETSYGFIIPENIDLKILENIGAIQANVQNQLLSTQQNSQ